MNIAIVDDEQVFLKQLTQKINGLKVHDYQITAFTSGQALLSNFVRGMYEIIILDVEMPGMNGLETAERIRQTDKSVIISFLTNYSEFAIKGYEVNAFRYILKSQPDYLYTQQLKSIFEECEQRFKTYEFSNKNLSFKCRLIDILYFEGHKRKVTLFTATSELEYSGNFYEICGEMLKNNFIIVNREILVNLEHIQNIDKYDIVMSNGKRISIGRSYKDEVVSKYLDFATRR